MQNFRNQDEDIRDLVEQHNFYAATKQCNEDAATAARELVSLQIILIGMFAAFILPLFIADLLLVATFGNLMVFLGAFRQRKDGKLFQAIMLTAVFQTLWRAALVAFSYFPQIWGGPLLTVVGYGFAALGLAQIIFLCAAFRRTAWISTQSKIPAALIGYILLFVLSFFQIDLLFIARAAIAALVGLYLRDVYNYSDIKNT